MTGISVLTSVPAAKTASAAVSRAVPTRLAVIQRACACGGSAGLWGKCEHCEVEARLGRPLLQPKLVLGHPDDRYERQADHIANEVTRMSGPAGRPLIVSPLIKNDIRARNGRDYGGEEALQPKSASDRSATASRLAGELASHGSGLALAPAARTYFEPRFGHDLGHIRVHNDATAARMASGIGAKAFTHGQHIYFASGQYDADSKTGRKLLAHEITHTLQQRADVSIQRSMFDDAKAWVANQVLSPEMQAFMADLYASVKGAPDACVDVLGEVWDSIRTHWVSFLGVLFAFLAAEAAVGALTAAPEPTFLTKLAAFILQALILVALGAFAAIEVSQIVAHAIAWWRLVGAAHGDETSIREASRAFCRVLLHIALLVLTAIGARAKVAGVRTSAAGLRSAGASEGAAGTAGQIVGEATAPRAAPAATATPPAAGPSLRVVQGGRGRSIPPAARSAPSEAFEGSAARQFAPQPQPGPRLVPEPPPIMEPAPAPAVEPARVPRATTDPAPSGASSVSEKIATAGSAVAAATEAATSSSTPCPTPPPGVQVRLEVPPQKTVHASIYRGFVSQRLLQHRVGRGRATNQREIWDRMMRGGEMQGAVYNRGVTIGLCERQILRPSWTVGKLWPDTQVDHIIEHQVAPIGDEAMIDQPWNFELLDQASNGSAGTRFDNNIAAERARLAAVTSNPAWTTCDLIFTELVAPRSAPAGRWSLRDVGDGEHFHAFTQLGLAPEDVC
ncbi:DUF4157 domain-containing protein [Bradyrhizobium sp. USDA 3458]|uniref:eCIS core domain-containing protein n=1 Tax=Bradyrhizobium sp. USDA 3458 TaxID=2591461 RepID=UPI0011418FFE|nr:DUF4157 domain-containing protein [Bradyrhizobium sp. USDA 3458]